MIEPLVPTDKLKDDFFESFSLFEMTPDLVCIAGNDGFLKKVNKAVIEKLGYTLEELFARPIQSFIYEEDKERTSLNRAKLLKGENLLNFQNRYIAKTGELVWLEWTSVYFADKQIVLAIAKDITAKKEAEKAIHEQYKTFKNLTTYFKGSIEKERKSFAYELHEDIAQLAAVVKLNVDIVSSIAPDLTEQTRQGLKQASATAALLLQKIQKISIAVSPYMLDEFGISVTLKWLCEEFETLHGIACDFEAAYDEDCLSKEIQIDFFRICQEALKNVLQHAEATKIAVSIFEKGNQIELSIKDDGKGFKLPVKFETHGLISMQERAASIHGVLNITSSAGAGTTISVTIPKP